MRFRINRGSRDHFTRKARIVFPQLGFARSMRNKVGNLMHENTRALEGGGAGLNAGILDDQAHHPAVPCEICIHFVCRGLHIDNIPQNPKLAFDRLRPR